MRRCDDHVAHDERLFDSVITYRLILRPRRADRTRPIARLVRSDGLLILLRLRFHRPAVLPDAASCQQDNNRTIQHDTTPQQLGNVYRGRSRSRQLEHISPLHCRWDNDNCMISSLHFPSRSRRTSSHSDCTSTLPGYNLNLSFQSAPDIQVPTRHRDILGRHPPLYGLTLWSLL